MGELKTFYCVRFSKKTGKVDTSLSGLGKGMLELWALQNTTTKSKDSIVFSEDGWVVMYCEGTGNFPNVEKYEEGLVDIDSYCEGLLDACKISD